MNRMFHGLTTLALSAICTIAQAQEIRMQGAGSTFVAPLMQRWTTAYQKAHPDVMIDYQSIGSGGGIKGITGKTLEFGASDAPMSKKEIEKAGGGIINIPVIAGDAAAKEMKDSLVVPLWDQPGKGVYPICGLVYVLVYQDLGYVKSEAKAKALADFLSWATQDGQKMASSLDYAPLNEAIQKKVAAALGTLTFSGKPVLAAK